MFSKEFKFWVVVETVILFVVGVVVLGLLVDQYDRAQDSIAERTQVARSTAVAVALLTATPPTATPPPATRTPIRTLTPTRSTSPTPSASPIRTATEPPDPPSTQQPGVTVTPGPPTLSPTPRPPRPTGAPTQPSWQTLTQCDDIDSAGFYRLGTDLTTNGECIKIKASGVVLDCLKHSIRGANFSGNGVAIRRYGVLNTTIPSYIEVRNCRISNFHDGIWVEAGDHLVIHDNDSSNNYDDTDPSSRFGKFLGMTDGAGIRLNNTTSSQVINNSTIHQAIGIDVRASSGISVRANTSSDNSAWGINFVRTQSSEAIGNTTTDNVRKCTWGAGTVGWGCDAGGIAIQDGSNGILVSGNSVTGRNGNGVFIKAHALPCGSNNTITGNTITGVYYNAVELGFCTGNRITNNNIREGLDGVWMGFARDTEIRGNTIANMRNHGIISNNSRGNTVSGNQIINSNEGLYFYSEDYDKNAFGWLPPGDYRSHDNCLCGNTFQSNAIAVHLQDSTNNQVTSNIFNDNVRKFVVQGNSSGNNLQGFDPWHFFPWGAGLAMNGLGR